MINKISIKNKLILSFLLIALMVSGLAFYSNISISKSSAGFIKYREMAKDSVLAGRVQANMLMVRMNVKDYIKTSSEKDVNEFNYYFDKTSKFIDEALLEIKKPTRAPKVKKISEDLKKYKSDFLKVVGYVDERNEIVNNKLNINGKLIEQKLTDVMTSARKDKDLVTSLDTAYGVRTLLLARLYTTKFLMSNSKVDLNRVQNEFENLENELKSIEKEINNPKRKKLLLESISLIQIYKNDVKKIENIILSRNEIINNKLNKIGPEIAKLSEEVKLSIKKDQDLIGPSVASLNVEIMNVNLVVAIIVCAFVILLGIFIPRGIGKSLDLLSEGLLGFFKYLNKEEDNVILLKINNNDEIGKMSKVINENIEKSKLLIEEDNAVINDVTKIVENIKHGSLTSRVERNTTNEVLQLLKEHINQMLNTLETNIGSNINMILDTLTNYGELDFRNKISNNNGNVEKAINNLSKIINEMLIENKSNGLTLEESSEILLENVDLLNKNSNETAASLEETAAALEEITSTIRENTKNVQMMTTNANELTNSSKKGESLAYETTNAMDEINQQVRDINEAIGVIDQIAFQTNILSLNAAVEAATAGEAGKGFAVVAQEVRNLAARSAEAAKEIKDIVEVATLKANEGKNISDSMIEGYQDLNKNIEDTLNLINGVDTASKEQLTGIEQINDAVTLLDRQTQENVNIANIAHDVAMKTDNIAKLVVSNANDKEFIGKNDVKSKTIDVKKDEKIKEEETAVFKDKGDKEWESF